MQPGNFCFSEIEFELASVCRTEAGTIHLPTETFAVIPVNFVLLLLVFFLLG